MAGLREHSPGCCNAPRLPIMRVMRKRGYVPSPGKHQSKAPEVAESFAYISERMLIGAQIIFYSGTEEPFAMTHLCGHSVEAGLKAILAKSGVSQDELCKKFGHDLERLWCEVAEQTDLLTKTPPRWLIVLNDLHGVPYKLRYPIGLKGLDFPNQELMYVQTIEMNKIMSLCVLAAKATSPIE